MKSFLRLLGAVVVISGQLQAQCSGCTINVTTGSSASYVVNAGQKLCISPTGTITGLIAVSGGSLCNQGLINTSKVAVTNGGYFVNYGTADIDSLLIQDNSSKYDNYGTAINVRFSTITGATSTNYMNITADYVGDSVGLVNNNGNITINYDLYNSTNGIFNNNNYLKINGSFYNYSNASMYTACKVSVAQNWYNIATVKGPLTNCGGFNIAGYSANSGTVGVSGQKVDICDAGSPASFDANSGNIANATFCTCTNSCVMVVGIAEASIDIAKALYPNPCNGTCVTEYSQTVKEVLVFTELGQTVSVPVNISDTKVEIRSEGLKAGIYFMQTLTASGKVNRQKLIVE